MKLVALLLIAIALGSTACGGGAEDTSGTIGTTGTGQTNGTNGTTETNGTTDTVQPGEKVGRITDLEELTLLVDQTPVNTLADLFVGNELETDGTGLVSFLLDAGSTCQMTENARVSVGEKGGVVLRFLQGTFWCSKQPGQGSQEYEAADTTISLDDPVFGVSVADGEATVKVTYGCVDVRGASGSSVSVGPEQQIAVAGGATVAPEAIGPAQLSALDRARSARLQSALPGLDVGPPDPGSSEALADVVQQDSLVVAVDPSDAGAESFGKAFADSLGEAWGVDVTIQTAHAEEAARQLSEREVDVVLTPSDIHPITATAAAPVPLFDDESGRTWQLNVADETFAASLREYVAADVRIGAYARRYKASIGNAVTYRAVVPVASC